MRVAFVVVGLVACSCWWRGAPAKPPPAPPVPNGPAHTCQDAAIGLERGARGVRAPDAALLGPTRGRCLEDAWPAKAIDCFAQMGEDELGICARLLDDNDRAKLFALLGGGGGLTDRAALVMLQARLAGLRVGIPECDNFVITVGRVLACDGYPLAARLQLGNETADLWALPTARLPADAVKRMAAVCDHSRGELEQRAAGAGCKL